VDPCGLEVGHRGAGGVPICVGDMLSDAQVRPGHVVVRLMLHKDAAQMRLTEDPRPIEYLAATCHWLSRGSSARPLNSPRLWAHASLVVQVPERRRPRGQGQLNPHSCGARLSRPPRCIHWQH
jgi:hypothetical protein